MSAILAVLIVADTTLVKLPARKRIGALAYAIFARGNDLGNGRIFYPVVAIPATLLVFAATIMGFAARSPALLLLALSASSFASIAHFIATCRAAPIMLSIGKTENDEGILTAKLDRFAFWHGIRARFQLLAFLAVLWALVLAR